MDKRLTIVGGGLSGLGLGLLLRRAGTPVEILEAQHYPRHRVCGEFLSGKGRAVLEQLGLMPKLQSAGAREARNVAFFEGSKLLVVRELPEPGLCLSRFRLDAILADSFREAGGLLRTGQRSTVEATQPGYIRATGRHPVPVESGWRWVGLKAHAVGAQLRADLEMHLFPDAYIGVCRIEEERVNVCGLFRSREPLPHLHRSWQSILRGPPDSALAGVLSNANFDATSFSAVAGISLRPRKAGQHPGCSLGDALGVIPPVTGNGMSIALESAAHAHAPLMAWSQGRIEWPEATSRIARSCDKALASRLKWAARLQAALMDRRWLPLRWAAQPFATQLLPLLFRLTR